MRIDIIGLIGAQPGIVMRALSLDAWRALGAQHDVRFIDATKTSTWAPRECVVLCTKFIDHRVFKAAKASGARVVLVNGGPGSVVRALNQLTGATA
jgi:phosphoserine phosphatase